MSTRQARRREGGQGQPQSELERRLAELEVENELLWQVAQAIAAYSHQPDDPTAWQAVQASMRPVVALQALTPAGLAQAERRARA